MPPFYPILPFAKSPLAFIKTIGRRSIGSYALVFLALLQCHVCRADDNKPWNEILKEEAANPVKEQIKEAVPEAVEIYLRARASRISRVYADASKDFMSLFGTANSLGKSSPLRKAIQSWAATMSNEYAQKAATISTRGEMIAATTSRALKHGAIPMLEQVAVAYDLNKDIEALQRSNPELKLTDQDLTAFFTETALHTIDEGLKDSARAVAVKLLAKALSTSVKGAELPIAVAWGVLSDPETAGGAEETTIPDPADTETFVAWAKSITEKAAYFEKQCDSDAGCLERVTPPLTGYISLYKLKFDYLSSVGSPMATRYAWVNKYTMCGNTYYYYCLIKTPVVGAASADYPLFRDVGKNHWANCYIRKLWSAGIVSGDGGDFRPAANVTRAEFVKMVMRAAYPPDGALVKGSLANYSLFDDISGTTLAPYIFAGVKAGVLNKADGVACSGNYLCFRPNLPISRLDAVRYLVSAFGLRREGTPIQFGDVSAPALEIASSVTRDAHCGSDKVAIVAGYSDRSCNGQKCFGPNAPLAREQAAKMIAVAMEVAQ